MHLSMHNWMRAEPLETTLARLQRFGYESIEISGEPETFDTREVRALLARYDLRCWGSVTLMLEQRNLLAGDEAQRSASVDYVKDCVTMVKELDGEEITIVPGTVGKIEPDSTPEAEWSWAIRFGGQKSASIFAWGRDMPPRRDSANYAGKSAFDLVPTIVPRYDDGFASTAPVGKFPASPIGIYDGAGNVAEWVNDFYTISTPGITKPMIDPKGPERGTNYVIRGSSWRHAGVIELRAAYRDYGDTSRPDVGFRIARSID